MIGEFKMEKNFDLKNFRENVLKLSRKEFAQRLGISEEEVKRYEEKPQKMPIGIFNKISDEFGIPMMQILDYEKSEKSVFDVKNNWSRIKEIKNRINLYLAENDTDDADEQHKRIVEIMKTATAKYTAKLKVVLLGRSDVGKSTIINRLNGVDKLPTDWQPMTAIIVYIKHIDDRPEYMKDDTVWVLKNDENGQSWDDSRLSDEEYTKSLMVAGGDESLLVSYGTCKGKEYKTREHKIDQISSAVLFVDSPILKCCDILDVPGFTGGRPSDEKLAQFASTKADILIYLSHADPFMSKEDFVYLKGAINNLPVVDSIDTPNIPKLANLFVIATKAHVIDYGNTEKISRILDNGCERFYSTLTENFWDCKTQISGHTYTVEDLRKRFFSYTTDIERLCTQFEESLRETLEIIPDVVEEKIIKALKTQKNTLCCELAEKLKKECSFRDEKNATELEYLNRIAEEPRIKQELEGKRISILNEINNSRSASKLDFKSTFNKTFNESNLVDMMKNRGVKNSKSSQEEFVAYLSSRMDEECTNAFMKEVERLKPKFEQYTEACQKIFDSTSVKGGRIGNENITNLTAKRAFVSGLSGAATYGALAMWASTLGNLGGYVIVTKAVSLLAALGIHIGGTAAVVGTVSALGGPIAWGLGIAVLIGSAVFGLLSGGWRRKLAKLICKELNEKGTLSECIKAIDKKWDDTEKEFNLGATNVVIEWDKQTNELKNTIDNYNIKEIEKSICATESTMALINNLPIDDNIVTVFNV